MGSVTCFLVEETDRQHRWLRRYHNKEHGVCPVMGGEHSYHNAQVQIEDGPIQYHDCGDGRGEVYHGSPNVSEFQNDPRWPFQCECGYAFRVDDEWDIFTDTIMRNPDTGEEWGMRELPPGAMFLAWWYSFPNHPSKPYAVVLPNGILFPTNMPATEVDGKPTDPPRYWTVVGEPPKLTVTPSIWSNANKGAPYEWHGYLTDGVLNSV